MKIYKTHYGNFIIKHNHHPFHKDNWVIMKCSFWVLCMLKYLVIIAICHHHSHSMMNTIVTECTTTRHYTKPEAKRFSLNSVAHIQLGIRLFTVGYNTAFKCTHIISGGLAGWWAYKCDVMLLMNSFPISHLLRYTRHVTQIQHIYVILISLIFNTINNNVILSIWL